MLKRKDKQAARQQVKKRIRKKVVGSAQRPRVVVFRSLKHIYAQAVDDTSGQTLAHASSLETGVRGSGTSCGNVATASLVGTRIAEKLLAAGCDKVVFDRSGYIYHGRVKALADAARAKGLKF